MKIYIDAAHTPLSPGAVYSGRTEWKDNKKFALKIVENLGACPGLEAVFENASLLSPRDRLKRAFAENCGKVFVLHRAFSLAGQKESGCRVTLPPFADSEIQYEASILLDNLCRAGEFKNKGVHLYTKNNLHKSLERPSMEGIFLFETGFIDNPEDNEKFDRNYRGMAQKLAFCAYKIWNKEDVYENYAVV